MNFRKSVLTAAAALTAAAVAVPAFAQPYDDGYQSDDRAAYADDRGYDDQTYDDQRDDDRSDRRYDDRSEQRAYGGDYDYRYENGRYDRRSYDRYDRQGQAAQCRDNRVAGTILGAIAGGVIGAQVDRHGSNDGSVAAGAVLGGLAGNSMARGTAACDAYGSYYGYNQTYPWRADYAYGRGYRRGGHYTDYGRQGCRMAVMTRGGYDRGQYVTVCPDRYGRYRVRY